MFEDKCEKIIQIFLVVLLIFIVGVQIGIHQGRTLQRQDDLQELYGYVNAD